MIVSLSTRAPVVVACHHDRESAVGHLLAITPVDYHNRVWMNDSGDDIVTAPNARLDFRLHVFNSPAEFIEFVSGCDVAALIRLTQMLGAAVAEFKNLPRMRSELALMAGLEAVKHIAEDTRRANLKLIQGGRGG